MLIVNTIRMAIFSRRREVAVMKLVGATNWFIRIPFMTEGMIQGLIGAIAASVAVYMLRNVVYEPGRAATIILNNLVASTARGARDTGSPSSSSGVVVGAAGSAAAVSRFLDV